MGNSAFKWIVVGSFVLIVLSATILTKAYLAESQAEHLARSIDSLRFGSASIESVERMFNDANIPFGSEECSSIRGHCSGLNIHLDNTNWMIGSHWISTALSHVSPLRKASLDVNLYFQDDSLYTVASSFDVGGRSVRVSEYLSEPESIPASEWKPTDQSGIVGSIRSSLPISRGQTPKVLEHINFHCMTSIWGCRSVLKLWPSAPKPTL